MASNTLLINIADLSVFTDIGTGHNTATLRNAVLKAQNFQLRDIIGKPLLDRYCADEAANITRTGSYLTLEDDYIVPFLTQAAYYHVLQTTFTKPRAGGISRRVSSPSDAAISQADFNAKVDLVQSDIDYYSKKMAEYIRENRNDFTELSTNADLASDNPNLNPGSTVSPLFKSDESILRKRRNNINPFR